MAVFCKLFYSLHILSILISSKVDAHGYLKSPRSRNWVAQNDGVTKGGPGADGVPERDSCPHCLNSKLANNLCSQGNAATLYDNWKDINGNPMPWDSQATYNEGEEITVESVLTTNHAGHMDMYICPDGNDSTQECLWNNPLTLIKDELWGGPTDPNYPERAYFSNSESQFKFTYKLPDGVCGEKVLVQWRYIAANSCFPPGYKNTEVGQTLLDLGWLRALGMKDCDYPYDPTGAVGSGKPEQFWNCAEITIKCSYPTVSRAPTPIPQPTPDPTSPPPTSTPTASAGYCNYGGIHNPDRDQCDGEVEGGPWCNENKSNCEGSCSGNWCIISAPTTPTSSPTEWPTYSPVQWPTYSPVQNPTVTPTTQPTPCVDKPKDKFFYKINKKKPIYKTCKWLAKKSQKKIGQICGKKTDSYNDTGPAKDVCKVLCGTCPTASPTETPPTGSPTKEITAPPTTNTPTTSPESQTSFSCSNGAGQSTWDALVAMESITYEVSQSPYILSAVASGGAAGDGSFVVSESQAYGVLTAGLTIMSMEESDPYYDDAKLKFLGYFNGWRQMCRNSSPPPCQNPMYCDGGSSACLPGWKHLADFSAVEGTGAAPDGDEDAIVGMIIALKAVELDSVIPSWYDEVHDWADRSCTQFLQDNTDISTSGSHRLLKLGSCWGGWGQDGNNPSYHAPGHFRMMRDFQASIKSRSYTLPSFVNTESWNNLIDTSYKFLETTQCSETGLVPNWALVKEVNSQTLAKENGSFSGSGTPQYEFGAEASRTLWRVAFDAVAYPEESKAQSGAFLAPLQDKMVQNFNPNPGNGWEYFGENTLQACNPIVSNVFGSWQWNYFISAPVFSTMVSGINSELFDGKSFDQQAMVNAACDRVKDTNNQGYYPLSWQVIAQMTLNGEVAKAGAAFNEPPIVNPTPTNAPTNAGVGCCTIDFKNCSPTVVGWCSESKQNCEGPCNKWWLPNGAVDGCIARYESCSTDSDCCSPGVCTSDSGGGKRCKAGAGTPPSPTSPSPPPIATPTNPSPTKPPTESPVSGPTCCSQFFNVCKEVPWCQESESNCKTCNGVFLPNLPLQCTARFGMCTPGNDECCYPSTCVTGTTGDSSAGQCMYYP